jgi:hypothetical protein
MTTHIVFGLLIGVTAFTPANGDEQLQDRCDRIAKEVGRLVGIELKKKVMVQRISRDEYRKSMRSQVEVQFFKKRIDGWIRSLQFLGLFDDYFDFEELLDHAETATNANYSPATKMIQIIPGSESSETDETVFHELVHAAQDQRHDLNRIWEQLDTLGSTDAMMAFRFLLEGEAVFWPMLYQRRMTLEQAVRLSPESQSEVFGDDRPVTSETIVRNFENNAKRDPRFNDVALAMKRSPPLIVRLFCLPYIKGDNAVLRIVKRDGRQALRQSFEDLSSLNTRDMLFPNPQNEKLRSVTKVQLPLVENKLGIPWKLKHADTMGALVLHTMFEQRGDRATEIARSWNGDRIELWEDADDGVVLFGRVEFETAEAATLFESELIRLCRENWMREKTILELESDGTHLAADTEHFVLERRECSVVFLRSTGCKNAATVASALWENETKPPKH